jgi:hypothetical protein
VAEKELTQCDDSENTEAAKEGHHYFGPPGGYKIDLRDGVTVRLRFSRDADGQNVTEYRISSRWKLPSPIGKLLEVVERIFKFFEHKKHYVIPFEEDARHHLLGCQLEQSLLADDCGKEGDSVGEAQHGQASAQIGIYSGLLGLLRWASTPIAEFCCGCCAGRFKIEMQDVELAEITIRVNLGLKKILRTDGAARSDRPVSMYSAPAHRALAGDAPSNRFALAYSTQVDAPTQVDASAPATRAGDGVTEGVEAADGANVDMPEAMEFPMVGEEGGVPDGAGSAVEGEASAREGDDVSRVTVLKLEDLLPEKNFFVEGYGENGDHACKPVVGALVIEDRRFMNKLFCTGKSTLCVRASGDLKHLPAGSTDKKERKRCPYASVANLFKKFAAKFPRLAVYDEEDEVLNLRDFPEDEEMQDKMHNDCMTSMRLTLKSVSEARVKWMSTLGPVKRELHDGAGNASRKRRVDNGSTVY